MKNEFQISTSRPPPQLMKDIAHVQESADKLFLPRTKLYNISLTKAGIEYQRKLLMIILNNLLFTLEENQQI